MDNDDVLYDNVVTVALDLAESPAEEGGGQYSTIRRAHLTSLLDSNRLIHNGKCVGDNARGRLMVMGRKDTIITRRMTYYFQGTESPSLQAP